MTICIETHGLTKTYGQVQALKGIDLSVLAGQVFGFLGPNGAGKTTTIRLLLALQNPTSGHASVLGLDAQTQSTEIHRRIGYLPGEFALYPRMTGKQIITWFVRARGCEQGVATDLIDRFEAVVDRPVRELSKGNRQKLGIILAFMHQPELLILDEPTSGLDPLMQHEFAKLVRETVADGGTVFLSSHELDEVQRLADRVAIIREGRLVASDTVASLRENAPTLIDATFKAPVRIEQFAAAGVKIRSHDGTSVSLEVSGRIGPILRVIADLEPIDVASRHPDLDELFMQFYRSNDSQDDSHAN
jgi:ABC-2 type transport system ATP-binding protein